MTNKTIEDLKQVRDALDKGGFHATARWHIQDALCITEALATLDRLIAEGGKMVVPDTEWLNKQTVWEAHNGIMPTAQPENVDVEAIANERGLNNERNT